MQYQKVVALESFKKLTLSQGLKDARAIHNQRKSELDTNKQKQGTEVGQSFH